MIPTASDVGNFLQGNLNYYTKSTLPKYQAEQIELRRYLCQSCDVAGKCNLCGCKTPNMYYAPLKHDKAGRWAEFMSEAQWNALVDNIDSYAEYIKILQSKSRGIIDSSAITADTDKVLEQTDTLI